MLCSNVTSSRRLVQFTGAAFLKRDDYKQFGEITAWRVSVVENSQLLGEQKSFLW